MTVMQKLSEAQQPVTGLAAKTNIRTPCGARHIANLRPGDLVVTRDNGLQPVRSVWSRSVTAAEIAADPSLAPVCLRPRAIGPMMPQRDLVVAGDHRLLIPGYRLIDRPDTAAALIPARDIAGTSDAAFVDRGVGDIVYFNLVFDAHQVFAANGLPVESFLVNDVSLACVAAPVREAIEKALPDIGQAQPWQSPLGYPVMTRQAYQPEHV